METKSEPSFELAAEIKLSEGKFLGVAGEKIIDKVIKEFIRQKMQRTPEPVDSYSGLMYRVPGGNIYYRDGTVTVKLSPFQEKVAKAMEREIEKALKAIAGMAYRKAVRSIVAKCFRVTGESEKGDVSVLTVEDISGKNIYYVLVTSAATTRVLTRERLAKEDENNVSAFYTALKDENLADSINMG